jgi:hypothetical protein
MWAASADHPFCVPRSFWYCTLIISFEDLAGEILLYPFQIVIRAEF